MKETEKWFPGQEMVDHLDIVARVFRSTQKEMAQELRREF